MDSGNIPVLVIQEETIPLAYEKAIREVWHKGISMKTEYDRPEDPASKDATVVIAVGNPFGQPRFHRSFADGLGGFSGARIVGPEDASGIDCDERCTPCLQPARKSLANYPPKLAQFCPRRPEKNIAMPGPVYWLSDYSKVRKRPGG